MGRLHFDEVMLCSNHAETPKCVSSEHLSKIWRMYYETAKRTLDVTSQRCHRFNDTSLSRNYSTTS